MPGFLLFCGGRARGAEHIGSVNNEVILSKLALWLRENQFHIPEGSASNEYSGVTDRWTTLRFY
jgi:hypothetical protein